MFLIGIAVVEKIADILEDNILKSSPELLSILLKDQSTSSDLLEHNILWATTDYDCLGPGYGFQDQILPNLITGTNGHVIMPRILKVRTTQAARIRDMAEVFTPAWICNVQNNQIDEKWFDKKNVFNKESKNDDGNQTWIVNPKKIVFPKNKTWLDYVKDIRLEITCGEAPYIVSRYDASTGEIIPLNKRIGLLDRKMRIIAENTTSISEWLEATEIAYKSTYGFEWQGDSLLIARESILYSFVEYYRDKFAEEPSLNELKKIAYIISWNIWQMDGLKGVVPNSCRNNVANQGSLFFDTTQVIEQCEGCKTGNVLKHTGTYCYIMDWTLKNNSNNQLGTPVRYVDLLGS